MQEGEGDVPVQMTGLRASRERRWTAKSASHAWRIRMFLNESPEFLTYVVQINIVGNSSVMQPGEQIE